MKSSFMLTTSIKCPFRSTRCAIVFTVVYISRMWYPPAPFVDPDPSEHSTVREQRDTPPPSPQKVLSFWDKENVVKRGGGGGNALIPSQGLSVPTRCPPHRVTRLADRVLARGGCRSVLRFDMTPAPPHAVLFFISYKSTAQTVPNPTDRLTSSNISKASSNIGRWTVRMTFLDKKMRHCTAFVYD